MFAFLGLLWLILAGLDGFLALVSPRSILNGDRLSPGLQASAFAWNLFALAVVLALWLIPPTILRVWTRSRSSWVAAAGSLPFTLMFWALLVAYFTSWGLFQRTGGFLDWSALRLMRYSGVQVIQHAVQMDTLRVFLAPLGTIIMALSLPWVLDRRLVKLSTKGMTRLLVVLTALILSAALGGAMGAWWAHEKQPRLEGLFVEARNCRVGPAARALAELRGRQSELEHILGQEALGGERFPLLSKPLISLDDYAASVNRRQMRPLNVIILLVESLRSDQLQAFGGRRNVMPTVEQVAEESLLLTNTRTQASHSHYADLCPLSSHYPLRSLSAHFYPDPVPYPRVLIYDILSTLGWKTAIFSSQNEGWGGMDNFLNTGHLDRFLHSETYDGSTYYSSQDSGFFSWSKQGGKAGKIDDRNTVEEAIRWIGQLDDDPFFIYMNLQNSHVPFELPADFPRRFGPKVIDFPLGLGFFPENRLPEVLGRYADSLAYVDSQLNRLVQSLKEEGRWDNTLLVITADTGQAFFEHGFAGHANELYDEVMKVPLVIRVPDHPRRLDDFPAQHVDIPPTVLSLLGLPPHPAYQGIDLLTPSRNPDRSIFLVVQTTLAHQYAVVRQDWKLIADLNSRETRLYDLNRDPGEEHNLEGEFPAIQKDLARRLGAWHRSQIDYYSNPSAFQREYPPVLLENGS